jgi:hypothetical protein
LQVRWDGADEPALELSLKDLFGSGEAPPERTSSGLSSSLDGSTRSLAFKLPMPFRTSAHVSLENLTDNAVAFELSLLGKRELPAEPFGHLHVQRRETVGPTQAMRHVAVDATGRGRLAGVCNYIQGHADPDLFLIGPDQLNVLEGDVTATIDGAPALDGTGTEEYADDVYYFLDAPHANAFVHAWGVVNRVGRPPGSASSCRWHVLGTELDFASSLELAFELGGSGNPGVVERLRTVAFLYQ